MFQLIKEVFATPRALKGSTKGGGGRGIHLLDNRKGKKT